MSKFAQACELSFNDWVATFPDEIPEAECSKKHERWKKRLFDKMRNDYYHVFTTKTVKVMLVAAILSMLLLTAFVIPSSREYIIDRFDTFSTYKITENNKNSISGEIKVGYIPEGFELESNCNVGKNILCKYESSKDIFFTIYKSSSAAKVEFNTEFSYSEEIVIDNIKYIYCKGDSGTDNLIWNNNDYIYRIDGNISVEELIEIAKTVE